MAHEHEYPERFDVREVLTRNEAEIVVRAFDRMLEREVLLKRLGPGARAHVGMDRRRAMREARALARVRNRHVLQLFDVIEEPIGPLLVLEPVAGESLADRVARDGAMPVDEALRIGREACTALDAIHREGIVHRGVSCSNLVQREDGSICLGGFSVAKPGSAMGQSSINYRSGDSFKTRILVPHPAPEQVAGQPADARSDIFGLGCVLFECLTGRPAFPNGITTGAAPDIDKAMSNVPKPFRDVVRKCLSRSPIGRYPTAAKLTEALELDTTQAESTIGRRPLLYKAAAAVLVAGLALFGAHEFLANETPGGHGGTTITEGQIGANRGRAVREADSMSRGRSVAVLIGISYVNNPDFPNLPNAEKDIERVAKALEALPRKWEIRRFVREQAGTIGIRKALAVVRDLHENDRALIYYAGHGMRFPKGDSGYVIPSNGIAGEKDPSYSSWIPFSEFDTLSGQTEARHLLVALDCCNSGRAKPTRNGGLAGGSLAFVREALRGKSHLILTSGKANEAVPDDSIFCDRFVSALAPKNRGSAPYLTAVRLFSMIQGPGCNAQLGSLKDDGDGAFLFFFELPAGWAK